MSDTFEKRKTKEPRTRLDKNYWALIEADWLKGKSSVEIAEKYNVNAAYVRTKSAEWRKKVMHDGVTWKDRLDTFRVLDNDRHQMSAYLECIELGMKGKNSEEYLGDLTLVERWKKKYPQFQIWSMMATRRFERKHLEFLNNQASRHANIALTLLERNHATREDYAAAVVENKMTIEFSFNRDAEPKMIQATPIPQIAKPNGDSQAQL